MVKKNLTLFLLFILVSLAHAAEGGRGSFWRGGWGGFIEDPGWRRRAGWRAASCRAAVGALPGRESLEHSAASFLEHLLLQKQNEKMLFEECAEGQVSLWAGRGCAVPLASERAGRHEFCAEAGPVQPTRRLCLFYCDRNNLVFI